MGLINSPPVIFPELTRSLEEKVTKLQSSKQIAKSPILDWEDSDMTTSLNLLKPGRQLNDEIVNSYLRLLREKLKKCDSEIHVASTRLLTSINLHPVDKRLVSSLRLASKFIILLYKPGHWRLAILERAESIYSLKIYDSVAGGSSDILLNLSKWLCNNGIKVGKMEISTTLQQNRFSQDCGLYILLIARIEVTPPTRIPPSDEVCWYIPRFRLRVLCEHLAAHLDPILLHYTQLEKTVPPEKAVPPGTTIPPEKTVLGPSLQKLSAQENIISSILPFNSEYNDLRGLSSILDRACSTGADKVGAIKILL